MAVSFRAVGEQAGLAIFDALCRVGKIPPAAVAQRIEGTVAEQAVECFGAVGFVTGKVLAGTVAEEVIPGGGAVFMHGKSLPSCDQVHYRPGQAGVSIVAAG